jgi:hypothetical protein
VISLNPERAPGRAASRAEGQPAARKIPGFGPVGAGRDEKASEGCFGGGAARTPDNLLFSGALNQTHSARPRIHNMTAIEPFVPAMPAGTPVLKGIAAASLPRPATALFPPTPRSD